MTLSLIKNVIFLQDAELFSFFSESKQLKDVNFENKETIKIDEWKGPVNLSLPYDSSESESDDDSACSSNSFTVKTKTFLFYNPKNRKMLESLQGKIVALFTGVFDKLVELFIIFL